MTDQVNQERRWSAGVGVITAMIAATLAVLGVTLVFGGYKQTVDNHTEVIREQTGQIKELQKQTVTKDDLKRIEDAVIRLENKIDKRR